LRKIEKIVEGDLDSVEKEEFAHEMNRYPLIAKRIGRLVTAEVAAEYREGAEELAELERNKPATLAMALCVTERGTDPGPMHLLIRGHPHAPSEELSPGFPEVLGGGTPNIGPSPNPETSGRRVVLADWITHKDNPLTARVMANRVWHYHFGRGLVRSPNDFGYQGTPPTHPELLDWLASELIRYDWQLKPLHREILRSRAYRMRSSDQPLVGESGEGSTDRMSISLSDPTNDLLWRFDPRRLTAEEIRDSILSVTGKLNLKKQGPWMYPEIEPEVLAGQSRPGHGWEKSSEGERSRRSIYVHVKRSLPVPLLALFDVAEPDFTCPARFATTQPTQALGLLNSRFLQDSAAELAKRVITQPQDASIHHSDTRLLVADVIQRVTQRSATEEEVTWGRELIETLRAEQRLSAEQAFERFCLVALNLNEFIYLD
jgi:hypothetical protein